VEISTLADWLERVSADLFGRIVEILVEVDIKCTALSLQFLCAAIMSKLTE
jgi:hypothetical protein